MNTPNLNDWLKEVEERANAATEGRLAYGPSEMHNGCFYNGFVVGPDPYPDFTINKCAEFFYQEDAELFVQARSDIPALLRVIRKLREQRDGLISDITDYWPNQKSMVTKLDAELARVALEGEENGL